MKLNLEQIRQITLGAAVVEEREDGFHFFRFTREQMAFYQRPDNEKKAIFATSGVKLSFRTTSKRLFLSIDTKQIGSRQYFSLDVFKNGTLIDAICNFNEETLPLKYPQCPLTIGAFEQEFDLGDGEKEICLHLPWNLETILKECSLDDGAAVIAVRPEKKLLCFGDSITQGFDTLHPSRKYTARLAAFLGMEEYNKAIGGEKFPPELGALKEDFVPALITVAYGTNDWRHRTSEIFDQTCRGFFENLHTAYPDTPILAIAPIWRKIWEKEVDFGPFRDVEKHIRALTADLENVFVVDAFDFIPHYSDYFGDLTLHPNAAGFDRYFEGLKTFLETHLKNRI